MEEEASFEEEGFIHFEDGRHMRSDDMEAIDFDPETIIVDSDVALGGAEVEVETAEATFTIRQGAQSFVQDEDFKEEGEDSDLSRFTHDHAYTFSTPTQETKPAKYVILFRSKQGRIKGCIGHVSMGR